MSEEIDVGFIIERIDEENNSLVFKPYSSKLKKDLSNYNSYNVSLNKLTPDNYRDYLLNLSIPMIYDLLDIENKIQDNTFIPFLSSNINSIITNNYSLSTLQNIISGNNITPTSTSNQPQTGTGIILPPYNIEIYTELKPGNYFQIL
jgi:hypothetical protein